MRVACQPCQKAAYADQTSLSKRNTVIGLNRSRPTHQDYCEREQDSSDGKKNGGLRHHASVLRGAKPAVIWPGTIWPGTIWPGTIWPGTIWPGTIWPGTNRTEWSRRRSDEFNTSL
jgi:hypothetical protein